MWYLMEDLTIDSDDPEKQDAIKRIEGAIIVTQSILEKFAPELEEVTQLEAEFNKMCGKNFENKNDKVNHVFIAL